jgi:hypothetical protein
MRVQTASAAVFRNFSQLQSAWLFRMFKPCSARDIQAQFCFE